jgi:hypothetical protein
MVHDYSAAYRALQTVWALGERVTLELRDRGWSVEPYDGYDPEDDEVRQALEYVITIADASLSWWWIPLGGSGAAQLLPVDTRQAAAIEGPVLWAGVSFDRAEIAPKVLAHWVEGLEAAGFVVFEEPDTARLTYIGAVAPLSELVAGKSTNADQVRAIADWIRTSVLAIERFGAP